MDCEKTELLKHLAVQDPAALADEPWVSHVRECAACHREWAAFAWSLAVYSHMEQGDRARLNVAPRWEAFRQRLAQEQATQRRARALAAPWLAGIMGLVLAGGVLTWGIWSESGEPVLPSFAFQDEPRPAQPATASALAPRRIPASMLTQVSTSGPGPKNGLGGYMKSVPEWRAIPRSVPILESNSIAYDSRSGEFLILPSEHIRAQTFHLTPVAVGDRSAGSPYGVAVPVR
jgi:hypothetical protein